MNAEANYYYNLIAGTGTMAVIRMHIAAGRNANEILDLLRKSQTTNPANEEYYRLAIFGAIENIVFNKNLSSN